MTDTAGTTGSASSVFSLTIDTHTPAAPTVTGITAATDTSTLGDGITSDSTPTVTGTGEPGTTVSLYDGITLIGTGTVDSTGHYSIATPTLTDGTHSLTTTVTDTAGTTGSASSVFSLTIDTHTPGGADRHRHHRGEPTPELWETASPATPPPTVTGTGEPGTTVSLYDGITLIGTGDGR